MQISHRDKLSFLSKKQRILIILKGSFISFCEKKIRQYTL